MVRRTARAHDFIEEIAPAFEEVFETFAGARLSQLSVLIDLRDVVGRNDPAFEAAVAPYRRRLVQSFGRAAVLVRTSIGAMHIQRLFQDEGIPLQVFTDHARAMRWFMAGFSEDPDA